MEFSVAIRGGWVELDAIPTLRRAFPGWFAWSPAAEAVRKTIGEKQYQHAG